MTKIALCLEYPLHLRGGVSVLVEQLLEGLAGHYRLVLVSPDASATEAGLPPDWTGEHVRWDPEAASRASGIALAEELVRRGVAIAHFHMGGNYGWNIRFPGRSPIVHCARRDLRVFATEHSVLNIFAGYCGPDKPGWFKLAMLPLAWWGKVQALHAVEAEISVSDHDLRKVQRWYRPLRRRYRRIHHSRLNSGMVEGNFAARTPTILSVGHIAFRKGQDVLLAAFGRIAAQHSTWRLQIAGSSGDDGCPAELQRMMTTMGMQDRVDFLGERRDAMDLMRTAGIFVQPSRHEALGLALQEALWVGCPAIGSEVGGIPEIIEPEHNGLLVPCDDPSTLAQSLDRMIGDPALRHRLADRARSSILAREMTATHMLDHHLALYQSPSHAH